MTKTFEQLKQAHEKIDDALREINKIINYMGNARFHTLCEPEVVLKPIEWD